MEKIYVKEKDISDMFSIPLPSLRNMRHKKEGPPFYKIKRSVFYKVTEVLEYYEKHKEHG